MEQRSYIAEGSISYAEYSYGMNAHCYTYVGYALMQVQLELGQ